VLLRLEHREWEEAQAWRRRRPREGEREGVSKVEWTLATASY
jgi:hypothetical protein